MPDSRLTSDDAKAWPVPAALAAAIALYNLVLSPIHAGPSYDWLEYLGTGVFFVQPFLLAAWVALGPGKLIYRLPVSAATLLVWIFAHSIADWNLFALESAANDLNLEMAVAFVTAFVIAAAVIGLLRRLSGIHISRYQRSPPPRTRHQFGVKYLLGWMTICALLIVIGRTLETDAFRLDVPWAGVFWEVAIGIAFVTLLMMAPAVLPLLALTRPTPWRWLLIIAAAWPVSLWAAVELMSMSARGGAPPPDMFGICGWLQIGATATALVSAWILRLAGFHLTSAAEPT